MSRSGRAALPGGVEILTADVADVAESKRACEGAAVVYHCVNPPYAKWPELHPPLMKTIIEGAASAGSTLIFGDNLYAYGKVDVPLTEDLPYRARGANGRTRARIAEELMKAHDDGWVRASIGRASDFFGPHVLQSTVGEGVFSRPWPASPLACSALPDVLHTVIPNDHFYPYEMWAANMVDLPKAWGVTTGSVERHRRRPRHGRAVRTSEHRSAISRPTATTS